MKKIISVIMSFVIISSISIFSVSADEAEKPTEVITETVTEKNTEEKPIEVVTEDRTEVDPTEPTEETTEETAIENIETTLKYQYPIILLVFVVLVLILCVQILK